MIQLILVLVAAGIGLAALIFSLVVAVKILGGRNKNKIKLEKPKKEKQKKNIKTAPPAVQKPSGIQFSGTTPATPNIQPQTVNGIRFEDDEEISLKNLEQEVTKFKLDD